MIIRITYQQNGVVEYEEYTLERYKELSDRTPSSLYSLTITSLPSVLDVKVQYTHHIDRLDT